MNIEYCEIHNKHHSPKVKCPDCDITNKVETKIVDVESESTSTATITEATIYHPISLDYIPLFFWSMVLVVVTVFVVCYQYC